MNDDRNRRQTNWGAMIGWVIFLLAIAGTPIINGLNQIIGGSFTMPRSLLPIILFSLLALSIIIPIVRSVGGAARSSGETRLPTSSNPTSRTPTPPQPPFGNTTSRTPTPPQPPFGNTTTTTRPNNTSIPRGKSQMPPPIRFEPIINPTILAFGVVGVLVLIGIAFIVLSLPIL